jgi:SpoVK/Ycf46/Vps4 family AAA+-type ATPase
LREVKIKYVDSTDTGYSGKMSLPMVQRLMSHASWVSAKRLQYPHSLEEFVAQFPDPEPFHVRGIIIDDLDRIDFSEEQFIPTLLAEIDDLGTQYPVMIIATTNEIENIPDVIRRAGRFTIHVEFTAFTEEMVDEYLNIHGFAHLRDQFMPILINKPPAWPLALISRGMDPQQALSYLQYAHEQELSFYGHDEEEPYESYDDEDE